MLQNIATLLAALMVLTALLLSFKSSRKIGKWLGYGLGMVAVLIGIAYGYFMRPIRMPAPPQANAQVLTTDTRTKLAESGFYLGAGTYTPDDIGHQAFSHLFNSYTAINALKIGAVLKDLRTMEYDFTTADRYIEEAEKQHLRIRGHALVFGKLSDVYEEPNLQDWLDADFPDAAARRVALQRLVDGHMEKMLTRYRGRVAQWDVVNEPLALFGQGDLEDNVFLRNLGPEYIANAFLRAHAVDPQAKLFLNEQFDRYTGPRADAFIALVQQLKSRGVPIHGVGLEHHMLFTLASAEETSTFIDRLTALGVEVEITELDARLRLFADAADPHLAQAEYYRDILTRCFAAIACKGVTFWGLHDQDAWHKELPWMFPKPNDPYLFDENKSAKFAAELVVRTIAQWQPRNK